MATNMIGYDSNRPGQDVARLSLLPGFIMPITTEFQSAQSRDVSQSYLDATDELLVAHMAGQVAWAGSNQQ